MEFKEHATGGVIVAATATCIYSLILKSTIEPWHIFGYVLAGSLFPDLDTNSRPSKIAALFGFCLGLWALWNREPYFALIFLTAFAFIKTFNHRTYTHLYTLPAILIYIAIRYSHPWLTMFSIGLLTHYALDCTGKVRMYPWYFRSWVIIPKFARLI